MKNEINVRNLTDRDIKIGVKSMNYIYPKIDFSTDNIYEKYGKMSGQNFLQDALICFAWSLICFVWGRIVDITISHFLGI